MDERIAQGLAALFDKHRIVFWYDAKQELRDAYEAVSLPDVEKIELDNNEFGIKHRILRELPDAKFLLYKHGPEPENLIDNWLLDVQLAHTEFRTDQIAVWLDELDLGLAFAELVREHQEFFRAAKRLERLKKLIGEKDTATALRLKMLAVCAASDPRLDSVLENLLAEFAQERDEKINLTDRCGLTEFLWDQTKRHYGYRPDDPGIADFALTLFKSCYAMGTGGESKLAAEALVLFKRWKNDRTFEEAFETLSDTYSNVLAIKDDLKQRDFRDLIEVDYFREIDREIIRNLVHEVAEQTALLSDVGNWIRQRRQSHWFEEFENLYSAIRYAAEFLEAIGRMNLMMDSVADGIGRYVKSWYRLDQMYRKFIYHSRQSAQASLMSELSERIENLYVNNFLLKLNDGFQGHIDKLDRWAAPSVTRQRDFFARHVAPFRGKDQKICVIISDALRYEIAEELLGHIRSLDRYDAEIEPMLSMVPSYTQLGMAALLPNKELRIAADQTSTVLVDGQSSQGLANRQKILKAGRPEDRSAALKFSDIMAMKGDDARTLLKDHDIVYIYHNKIDAIGDKPPTEEQAFDAAEDALGDLTTLVKKLTSANASNLLVTADHGFLFQNRAIEESDFLGSKAVGEKILYRDRRFILGQGLTTDDGFRKFTSEEAGLEGDVEILLPKSINRLRLKGSGSRFVHGGATLQEVVVPVLKVNKKRQSDVVAVEVDIVGSPNKSITSGQIAVLFYQSRPVTEKVQPRLLRAGIYSQSGTLISDRHDLVFDLRSDNPRDREMQVRFLLAKAADEFNGQEVILKLEEQHSGTSHFKEYKSIRYLLKRSFGNDFDF